MRVGIMTMHRIPNYGSFLQALSLKMIIESLGHEVIFVDFKIDPDVEHRGDLYSLIQCKKKSIMKIIRGTKIGSQLFYFLKEHSSSKDIIKKQLIFSSCNDMLGVSNKYHYRCKVDVLIIGSDEVFNCTQFGNNVGYSLELFGKDNKAKKIITYAASFGSTTMTKINHYGIADELGILLNKMQAVSVRDHNSFKIVQSISNKKPFLHLDPVLVGNIENLFNFVPQEKGYVILYGYTYRFTKEECNAILEFAHSHNKKVIALGEPQYKCDNYICCKPDEVMGYFKNSDYIFTDTFHGTIFSVINHKQFLTIVRTSGQSDSSNQEKLESLLSDLGLEDRRLSNLDEISKVLYNIDYDRVDSIRKLAKNNAIRYLSKFVN
ncbi:hypothetical protein HNQ43_001794 [Faecalicoccus acidiformans]|uniref:Polysaccharide pyruvyl transferase domain-containing protein n=1 Tax=Faecalicoccus acidiformans TaxID=915173 RepID=A0A7W8D2T4_9FIRM|nr:polysaccharide pyruvyl transferase family protein [Faecalicoccus acidiformans]MBB5185714.1 hypothetical protein [Faecalicoccus acidiformans]